MNNRKTQIIYIIVSGLFVAAIIAIPLIERNFRTYAEGNGETPELANLKEIGITRVLEGKYKNATATLRLKYEDERRQKFFEETLAESWGFDVNSYHVFILDIQLDKVALQTLPNGETIKTDALESYEVNKIEIELNPQITQNIDLEKLVLKNTTKQGTLVKKLQSEPMKLKAGEKTSRYVFFKKDFKFDDINTALLYVSTGESIVLKPKKLEYPIPPTVQQTKTD